MRQVLLQSATGITKCDNLLQSATGITKCDDYYKVRQYTCEEMYFPGSEELKLQRTGLSHIICDKAKGRMGF